MQDYMKKNAQRGGQRNNAPVQAKETNGIPNSALQDVFAGRKHATSEMMGHSQNLAPSIAAKMSRAFGMDLTGMQVYQSDAMKGTGMRGMAQGNKVVLSSDVDLNTTAGQAVLGHEISHIHAQSQGIGMGHSGLYENAALEHQADTEGLLAAQGRSIYSDGMDAGIGMQYGLGMKGVEGLTPLSGGMSASAGAPMQADEEKKGPIGWIKGLFSGGKKKKEEVKEGLVPRETNPLEKDEVEKEKITEEEQRKNEEENLKKAKEAARKRRQAAYVEGMRALLNNPENFSPQSIVKINTEIAEKLKLPKYTNGKDENKEQIEKAINQIMAEDAAEREKRRGNVTNFARNKVGNFANVTEEESTKKSEFDNGSHGIKAVQMNEDMKNNPFAMEKDKIYEQRKEGDNKNLQSIKAVYGHKNYTKLNEFEFEF